MADFGVGVAGGVLIEIGKAIIEVVKEVKENKKQCKVLGGRCLTIAYEINNVVVQNKASLSAHQPTYLAVKAHVTTFDEILREIQKEMKQAAEIKSWWTRIRHKGEMQEKLQELDRKLSDRWQLFENFLTVQHIATSTATVALLSQSVMDNAAARKEDAEANAQTLKAIQQTVALASQVPSALDEQTNKIIAALDGHKNAPVDEAEDPEVVAQRREIQEAIRAYAGEGPSIGIDSSELTIPFEEPFHRGQNAEIYKGIRGGTYVAIKKLNLTNPEEVNTVYKRILRESHVWSQLRHPNIAQFLGCCRPKDEVAYMISAWYENGDARKFLKKNKTADRLKLLNGVIHGLDYLHTFVDARTGLLTPIVHASLKGTHVLIDSEENVHLSDFGISFIANEVYPGSRPPATRWSAPEVLDGGKPTTKSDIYSLGMVIFELITREDPFHDQRYPDELRKKILKGTRPKYPTANFSTWGLRGQDSPLWLMLKRCWAVEPVERPTNMEVLEVLQEEINTRTA